MAPWRALAPDTRRATESSHEVTCPKNATVSGGLVASDARKLGPKQRLALVHSTTFANSTILAMSDDQITFQFLLHHSVSPVNIAAAGLDATDLFKRGASDAASLVLMGFDALHLTDTAFCESCLSCFGAPSVLSAFLQRPIDAVSLAGSGACHQLGIDTNRLLMECPGAATEALAVLKQQPTGVEGVSMATLLDTGLRARQLAPLGYTAGVLAKSANATTMELAKIGYTQ